MLRPIALQDHAAHEQILEECRKRVLWWRERRVRCREVRANSALVCEETRLLRAQARALQQQRWAPLDSP